MINKLRFGIISIINHLWIIPEFWWPNFRKICLRICIRSNIYPTFLGPNILLPRVNSWTDAIFFRVCRCTTYFSVLILFFSLQHNGISTVGPCDRTNFMNFIMLHPSSADSNHVLFIPFTHTTCAVIIISTQIIRMFNRFIYIDRSTTVHDKCYLMNTFHVISLSGNPEITFPCYFRHLCKSKDRGNIVSFCLRITDRRIRVSTILTVQRCRKSLVWCPDTVVCYILILIFITRNSNR